VNDGAWLAIDTGTDIASVAAGRHIGSGITRSESGGDVQGARRHAAEIVRLVDFALGRIGATPRELDGIVVGDGPGSFTGLRIGWAVVKGLAQESGVQVVAVPSLLAAAAGAAVKLGAVPIAACFDALRGDVYGAVYVIHPDRVETLAAPATTTLALLASTTGVVPALVVGDGAMRYPDVVLEWSGALPVPLASLPPLAAMSLSLFSRAGAARAIDDLSAAEPAYGRPAEAQVKWEARHGRPLPDPSSTPR